MAGSAIVTIVLSSDSMKNAAATMSGIRLENAPAPFPSEPSAFTVYSLATDLDQPLLVAGSIGRRNTVHPYRQGFEAYGLPAMSLSDDPRLYIHE